jgi:UDP-N-acetylglucosamine:LPS N-acetylglucosamine transferase
MKLLIVLGDGGHSAEMLQLLDLLGDNYQYNYMMADNDQISESKIKWDGPVYRVLPLRRKRLSDNSLLGPIKAIYQQFKVLLQVRPAAILSTGANIAIPVSLFGRLMGAKVIHVETGSRVYAMSSTGKVMYRLANMFFVQWEPLQEKYPEAIYAGRLL